MHATAARLAAAAPKGKVPINMQKWWNAYTPMTGQVTRSMSPFHYNVLGSLFKDAPTKLTHKVTDNLFDVAPGLLTGVAVVMWAEWKHEDIARHHRS